MLARKTGWPERYIRKELPYARGLLYQHAILRSLDLWTVGPEPAGPEVTSDDYRELLDGDTSAWL